MPPSAAIIPIQISTSVPPIGVMEPIGFAGWLEDHSGEALDELAHDVYRIDRSVSTSQPIIGYRDGLPMVFSDDGRIVPAPLETDEELRARCRAIDEARHPPYVFAHQPLSYNSTTGTYSASAEFDTDPAEWRAFVDAMSGLGADVPKLTADPKTCWDVLMSEEP